MPPQRRTIFLLSRQEHLSRQEIAQRLGISLRTVDKHLELALHDIRLHRATSSGCSSCSCSAEPALHHAKRGDHRPPRP